MENVEDDAQKTTPDPVGVAYCESDELDQLLPALAQVQGAIKQPAKAEDNPYYNSKYAGLPACWAACRSLLHDNGLVLVAAPCGGVLVVTLYHVSGQWIRCNVPLEPTQNTPQAYGSCVTYMRRYSLCSLLGITPDEEDDDGNAASGVKPDRPTKDEGRARRKTKQEKATPVSGEAEAEKPAKRITPPTRPDPYTLRKEITDMVLAIGGGDVSAARGILTRLVGKNSTRDIPDKQLVKAHDTISAAHTEWHFEQNGRGE